MQVASSSWILLAMLWQLVYSIFIVSLLSPEVGPPLVPNQEWFLSPTSLLLSLREGVVGERQRVEV